MKRTLLSLALSLTFISAASAHEDLEFGPNGGRVLEFSKDQTWHGEVWEKDGRFHIAVLDKDLKPAPLTQQTLTATTGDRSNPQQLPVEKKGDLFIVPIQKGDDHWTIFQFKTGPEAKPVTARLHYDKNPCPECKKPEWLCECASEKAAAEKKKEKK